VRQLYVFVFARPGMQAANDLILQLALKGRGYNNWWTPDCSGEANFIELLAKQNPQFCVDIGANEGLYAAELLRRTRATVVAFEPLPKAFRVLEGLRSEHPGRLFAYNCGIGDRQGDLELFYGDECTSLASFSKSAANIDYVGKSNVKAVRVPVVTLDGFFAEEGRRFPFSEIDFLKIDTEGYEYNVLVGARETIRRMRPRFVQLEFNWHQLFSGHSLWVLSELLPGYATHQLLPYGRRLYRVDPKRPESNFYYYSNFVFVRNDVAL
jgi:FkbM family methyltransferase